MYELTNKKITYNEYAAINDGKRYELINGELIMAPAPSYRHQNLSGELFFSFKKFSKEHDTYIVLEAPIDVILDETNTIQPDIVIISSQNRNIIEERGIFGVPDLIVEIVSPSTIIYDRYVKKDLYEKFGVKEFWIADYNNKSIEVLLLRDGKYELFASAAEGGIVKSKVIEGFELELKEVF